MRLIESPRVELVSRPVMQIDGVNRFLVEHNLEWPALRQKLESNMDLGDQDGDWIVELAARLCYMSYGGKGRSHEEHLHHLIEVGHGSCLEHANYAFLIWNVSRSLTHELVRHRVGVSYSQLSQRYVDESDTDFVVPPAIQELRAREPAMYERWVRHMEQSVGLYTDLTTALSELHADIADGTERRKKARQAARSVLPNATETKIFVGANVRAMRHLIEMRAHAAADLEIRRLFVEMFKVVKRETPLMFWDMELVRLPDGTFGVTSQHVKV